MSIVLVGSTSGSITLQEPAIAGTTVLNLPATSGTVALTSQVPPSPSAVGQVPFSTDGSTYTATAKIVSGTSVSASGTSVDFTGIPSWVKRITVMFNAVSTNGSSIPMIQLGSGSFTTSGYVGSAAIAANGSTPAVANMATGILLSAAMASTFSFRGSITINLIGGNIWIASGVVGQDDSLRINWTSGAVGVSGALDRVRITTVNGTDAFDAGTINILYE